MADRHPHELYEHVVGQRRRWLPGSIADSHERVLSGRLDDNLPTIFGGLLEELYQWAIFRYCYDDASVDEFQQLMGQGSLAGVNLFAMTGLTLSSGGETAFADRATIEWQGKRRTVPRLGHHSAQDQSNLLIAVFAAILSNREEDLRFLARVPPRLQDHPDIITPDYHLLSTQLVQLLCREADAETAILADKLTSLAGAMKWKSKLQENYFLSELELFLAVPGGDADKLAELVAKHLDAHEKLYDTDKAKGRGIVQGLMAIPAMCGAVLAGRRGTLIEVDNKYFPREIFDQVILQAPKSGSRQSSVLSGIKGLFGRKN